jgi:heme-degrading monooxygenase HmoA
MIAKTQKTPYYAVIFTSTGTEEDSSYSEMADKMLELAKQQDGFLGVESARNELGITVSYWRDLNSIKTWKENTKHSIAQKKGRTEWYNSFKVRIAKVERDYEFEKE